MDPINDVNRLCPCWIVMIDGSRHLCNVPVSLSGNPARPTYRFISGITEETVEWANIAAFESIANPNNRIPVR